MKLARRATDDPERIRELEATFDDRVSELLSEANDAGYSTAEATRALLKVVQNKAVISDADPDPADDPLRSTRSLTVRYPAFRDRDCSKL